MDRIKTELKKRNGLTVRWPDSVHEAVCDIAWKQRQTVSSLIRGVMLRYLKQNGVRVDEIE
ncbi:MAG TPA: hypothetical protein P5567_13990 [Kiritimatiellia bacterium]|nr:hypothetical protein [Kiritimatiellia bacterium]HSA19143.1 hypothetical protein [Kiritimatiellia bacterium]